MENNIDNHLKIQSINYSTFVPTFLFFILGLFYYFYKFRNLRQNINENNIPREMRNTNVQDSRMRENINNENNIENLQNNIENTESVNEINSNNAINIFIQIINSERKAFRINKNTIIKDFITNDLSRNVPNFNYYTHKITLICQGRRLDDVKTFAEYSIISENTVLHCFVSQLNSAQNNQEDARNNSYSGANNNNIPIEDPNSVSVYTLIYHFCIFIIFLFLLYNNKHYREYVTKAASLILQLLIFFWILGFAKVIAKLIVYRKINWSFI